MNTPTHKQPSISQRDMAVLQLVARFKQLSSRHIYELLYAPTVSYTPCNRTLRRLTDAGWLDRIERRIVGGSRGGSGQYVYQLGRRGWFTFNNGRYTPARTINHHALGIADCFVTLRKLEGAGVIELVGVSTEPDCWTTIAGIDLRPDLHIELLKVHVNERLQLWLEMDMATESQRQLKGKLGSYWRAYDEADVTRTPVFPRVVWVAVDDERAKELRWLIERGPKGAQILFDVVTRETLANLFITATR